MNRSGNVEIQTSTATYKAGSISRFQDSQISRFPDCLRLTFQISRFFRPFQIFRFPDCFRLTFQISRFILEIWKSGKIVEKNWKSGNLDLAFVLYVAVKVSMSRFPDFQIFSSKFPDFQICRMNLEIWKVSAKIWKYGKLV